MVSGGFTVQVSSATVDFKVSYGRFDVSLFFLTRVAFNIATEDLLKRIIGRLFGCGVRFANQDCK